VRIAQLELDLDVFAGPFDLLLSLILREELDLLEVDLAEVVVAYLDHLEAQEQLDLESATEFLVLIAALLELKSRLMLPGEEVADWLAPVRERFHELRADEAALEERLAEGAGRARALAAPVVADVRDAMGVGPARRSVGPAA
jgi:chromatin segregation and condensation protein Rec8/ScpA/Scc1 (kleisin family)